MTLKAEHTTVVGKILLQFSSPDLLSDFYIQPICSYMEQDVVSTAFNDSQKNIPSRLWLHVHKG